MEIIIDDLLEALEAPKVERTSQLFQEHLGRDGDAWDIHLSVFSVAQRVLNPPFINPHLPKMYGIYRELMPVYLRECNMN